MDIITFFFEEFLESINPELKVKFKPFKDFFIDFISHKHHYYKDDIKYNIFNRNYNYIQDFYCFLMLIYINKKYPDYNPTILIYIYKTYCNNYQEKKNFFSLFIKCIRQKGNIETIPINLFLLKKEDIKTYFIKKINYVYMNEPYENKIMNNIIERKNYRINYISHIYKFISKYLIDLKYVEYSLVHFYISKIFEEIDEYQENEENEENEEKKENEKKKK